MEFEKYLIANTPSGRFGQPEDMARGRLSCLG